MRNLGQSVDEWRLSSVWLAWGAHAFEHVCERLQHVDVHLGLWGDLRHRAAVVFELIFTAEEDSGFATLKEFS